MAKYTKEMEYNKLAKRGECFLQLVIAAVMVLLLTPAVMLYCGAVIVWTRNTRRKDGRKLNTRFQETRRRRHVHISLYTVPVIISTTL